MVFRLGGIEGMKGKESMKGKEGVEGKEGMKSREGMKGREGRESRESRESKEGVEGKESLPFFTFSTLLYFSVPPKLLCHLFPLSIPCESSVLCLQDVLRRTSCYPSLPAPDIHRHQRQASSKPTHRHVDSIVRYEVPRLLRGMPHH